MGTPQWLETAWQKATALDSQVVVTPINAVAVSAAEAAAVAQTIPPIATLPDTASGQLSRKVAKEADTARRDRIKAWFNHWNALGRSGLITLVPDPARSDYQPPSKGLDNLDPQVEAYLLHFLAWSETKK